MQPHHKRYKLEDVSLMRIRWMLKSGKKEISASEESSFLHLLFLLPDFGTDINLLYVLTI